MIFQAATGLLLIVFALAAELASAPPLGALAALPSISVLALSDDADCAAFQRWFARQSGSQLVLRSTGDFYKNSMRPRRPDTILDYSVLPVIHNRTSWYRAMRHSRNHFGGGGCLSGFYDSAHKTALIYSQYDTASDLTITPVSSASYGLPIHPVPTRTRNGVRLGMTLQQVTAIDGPGTRHSNGRFQLLTYNQGFKRSVRHTDNDKAKTSAVEVISYLGFLFLEGKLVAINAGGGM